MTFKDTLKQFFRFGVVGTIGAVIDFGSYGLLTRVLDWKSVYCWDFLFQGTSFSTSLAHISQCSGAHYPLIPANMTSVFLAIISNFFLNKFWTFKDVGTHNMASQGVGYLILSIIAWILNQVLIGLFVSRLVFLQHFFAEHVDVAAKVLAIVFVMFLNYTASRYIIFRRVHP